MACVRDPEEVLLARASARHAWRDAMGALPLAVSALLWAWVLAGVLGPLGTTMTALEGSIAPRRPAGPAMIARAPAAEPAEARELAAAARLRHR